MRVHAVMKASSACRKGGAGKGLKKPPDDCPGEATDDWDIAVFIHAISHVEGNAAYGIKVVWRGHREAGLDDVHAQLSQLPGDVQLLFAGEGGPRRLLAVPQCRIKYSDVIEILDAVGYVLWSGQGGRLNG